MTTLQLEDLGTETLEEGRYVNLIVRRTAGKLYSMTLELTEEGREVIEYVNSREWVSDTKLAELLEDHITGGWWEFIAPEEVGALTDAPILAKSDNVHRTKTGRLWKVTTLFWYPDYALRCPVDVLARVGRVTFVAAE